MADHRTNPIRQHNYGYSIAGALNSVTFADGMTHAIQRNLRNHVTGVNVSGGAGTIESFGYTVDALGQRTQVSEGNGRVVAYQRDVLNRLIQESISGVPAAFARITNYGLSAVGYRASRTSTQPSIANQAFTLNANGQLAGTTYDANGNTTATNGNVDIYDFEDRLIRRTKADGSVIDFVYDANGQRVQKTKDGVSTGYLIDTMSPSAWPQCVAEVRRNGSGVWEAETTYIYGPTGPISQWTATQGEHHFLLDAHGSVRALVDSSGQVAAAMDYDAHGLPLSANPPNAPKTSLGYNGEHYDEDLGMIYLRARWYDPTTGRFHTRVPYQGTFEDPMSMQGYLYAHGNPVDNIDPSGNYSIATMLTGVTAA